MSSTPESAKDGQNHDLVAHGHYMFVDADVADIVVSDAAVNQILQLNTPDELLGRDVFQTPVVIRPDTVANGLELLAHRDSIRRLELVPEKTQEMYDKYHGYTARDDKAARLARQRELAVEVEKYFEHTRNFAFVRNMYPYNLPPDIKQYIAWMKQMDTPRIEAAKFIAQCLQKLDVSVDDTIIFERSLKTSVDRVRGSFPVYRHIHVWLVERGTV